MPLTELGEGSIHTLASHLERYGKRAFVVSDPGVQAAGVLDQATAVLDDQSIEWMSFVGVDPNPTDENIVAGVAALREFGIEGTVVVLVGGGSAMDCGKYIAMAAPSGIDDLSLARSPELDENDRIDLSRMAPTAQATAPAVPTIAVPTTSGTASETNGGGVITRIDDHRKLIFNYDDVLPKAVILDPALTVGLPAGATAACGMDALTHSIEAYTSTTANPYCDAMALHAIRLTSEWLPRAVADGTDMVARANMQIASHLAGRAMSSGAKLGLVHATGHPLSAHFGIAHGQTLATMMPHVMRFNIEAVRDRYADIGQAMGVAADAEAAIDAIEQLSATVGTNRTLSDLGATADHIDGLTTDALRDVIILTTPRYPTRAEIAELYHLAL